jgi:muramoyltetrapeptide carboxypeptidase
MSLAFFKPQAVRPGDTVAVVAPAGPFDRASFEAGLAVISGRYAPRYDEGILSRQRYLAGDDDRRFSELVAALTDPEVKAVFCARGGYGAMRLLPRLAAWGAEHGLAARERLEDDGGRNAGTQDPERRSAGRVIVPKPLIGFSDMTALHLWLHGYGIASIHAPVLTQLGRMSPENPRRLFSLLESGSPAAPLVGTATYVPGTVEGPLLGGNLSVFTRLLGTPFMPSLEGAVLLLEDLSEQPYRLDRMWMHLELAGVFRQVRGIVLGQFLGCEPRDGGYTAAEVLRDLAIATGVPCAAGFPIGHGDVNEAVGLGVRVRLEAGRGEAPRVTFLEAAAGAGAGTVVGG